MTAMPPPLERPPKWPADVPFPLPKKRPESWPVLKDWPPPNLPKPRAPPKPKLLSDDPSSYPKTSLSRGSASRVTTGTKTMTALKAGRAGHCAVAVDKGKGMVVFGGMSIDQGKLEYDGDTVYHNDVFWLTAPWNQRKQQFSAKGISWWGPLKFPGKAPSPRSDMGCGGGSLVPLGPVGIKAIVVFGGYNGKGRCCGYFNDLHAIINVERDLADEAHIRGWMRRRNLIDWRLFGRKSKPYGERLALIRKEWVSIL